MTSQVANVQGNLTAVTPAAGSALPLTQFPSCIPTVYLGGVFVATVQLQARPTGNAALPFEPITPIGAASANMTTAGMYSFQVMGGDWEFQLVCTAYTSGTVNAALGLSPNS